jgi:predicted enzyme related to lactoylglutathione lyase
MPVKTGCKKNVTQNWGVSDIQKTYTHFLEVGATNHEAPYNVGGELMVATVKDPWGNCIGLIYNPAFKLEE